MTWTTPRLPLASRIRPIKLRRTIELLKLDRVAQGPAASAHDVQYARDYVEALRADRAVPPPDRGLINGLLALYAEVEDTEARKIIVDVVLGSERARPWALWLLWQHATTDRERISTALAEKWLARLNLRPHYGARLLPPWLPHEATRMRTALAEPAQFVRVWSERDNRPVTALSSDSLRFSLTSAVGREVISHLIERGSRGWWKLATPDAVRAWAGARDGLVLAKVAQRQLLELGGRASYPSEIPRTTESTLLRRWVMEHLGDPHEHPGRWKGISDAARQIYDWLALADEFDRILKAFRSSAERERADFWQRYFTSLTDAYFYEANDTAVCLMVFSRVLIIEFGTTGNATYVYEAPQAGPPLRARGIPKGELASYFKERWRGLRLGREVLPHIERWMHTHGSWQGRFSQKLARYDLYPGARPGFRRPESLR